MMGYKVLVGIIPEKAGEIAYFLKRREAQKWAEQTIKNNKELLKIDMKAIITKTELNKCSCGSYTEETECLRCQDLRAEAQQEAYDTKYGGENDEEK